MIDPDVFADEWALLCERFNREASGRLAEAYYDALSAVLTTGQFIAAAKSLFILSEFFPTPQAFIQAGGIDPQADALDQWELCERVMAGEHHIAGRMNEAGKRVLLLLGGPRHLGLTALDQVGWVRKEFLALYHEVASGQERAGIAGPEVTPESRRLVGEVMAKATKEREGT